jgi:FkbM family methyltransferase
VKDPLLQRLASRASRLLGRDSAVIRALRPLYEWLLDRASGGRGFVRVVNGRERFHVNPRWRGLFPEVYEPPVCEYLRERVRGGDTCLNVGAHVGILALCLAKWSAPDGRVWAFEPNPRTARILGDHVRRNSLQQRVSVIAQAVSKRPGTASFFADAAEGTSRLGSPNPDRPGEARRIPVNVTTIDEFCRANQVRPDWIVMDVEGYEVAALEGARETIHAAAGGLGLVIELHPHLWESAGTSRAALEALLAALRLTPLALQGQRDPLAEPGVVALVRLQAA